MCRYWDSKREIWIWPKFGPSQGHFWSKFGQKSTLLQGPWDSFCFDQFLIFFHYRVDNYLYFKLKLFPIIFFKDLSLNYLINFPDFHWLRDFHTLERSVYKYHWRFFHSYFFYKFGPYLFSSEIISYLTHVPQRTYHQIMTTLSTLSWIYFHWLYKLIS